MYRDKIHQQFIELRSEGSSFRAISKELNISLPTLVKWSRQFAAEISDRNVIFLESCLPHPSHAIDHLKELTFQVHCALETAQFSRVSFNQLLRARKHLHDEMEAHRAKIAAWMPEANWDDEPSQEQPPTELPKAA